MGLVSHAGLYRVKRGERAWVVRSAEFLRLAAIRGEQFDGLAALDAVMLFEVFEPLRHDDTLPKFCGWAFLSEAQERVVRASWRGFDGAVSALEANWDRELAEAARRAG